MTPIIQQPEPLQTEVNELEKAKEIAIAFGTEPTVEIEGEKFKVKDPDHTGIEIEPV